MKLILKTMEIDNFKGMAHRHIEFSDDVTEISGANATGKTTIVDAYLWTLFDKDSHGNASGTDAFRSKPLDAEGKEKHNLNTSVELVFDADGNMLNLKRVQSESWIARRGSAEKEFKGNVSKYYINGVECKLTEFRQKIAEIADEQIFRLVGTLGAFNAMAWQDRRNALIDMAGKNVDNTLLAMSEYKPVADECARLGLEPEKLRKYIQEHAAMAKREQAMIPVRIDEATKALPDITENDVKDAQYTIHATEDDITHIDAQITAAKAESGITERAARLKNLEMEQMSIRRTMDSELCAMRVELQNDLRMRQSEHQETKMRLESVCEDIDAAERKLKDCIAQRDALRVKFREVARSEFVNNVMAVCPTCHRQLEADAIVAAVAEAKAQFNKNKAELKDSISNDGKTVAAEIDEYNRRIEALENDRNTLLKMSAAKYAEVNAMQVRISQLPSHPKYADNPRMAEIQAEINSIRVDTPSGEPTERICAFESRKLELQETLRRANTIITMDAVYKGGKKRIAELEERQSKLNSTVCQYEIMLELLARYVQDRCACLEDSINQCFPTIRWKLFNVQLNGGIQDCCMCMIPCSDGALVTYESANTASKINADIEIIGALSNKYGLKLPLFVDNAERVNQINAIETQMIALSVSRDAELIINGGM